MSTYQVPADPLVFEYVVATDGLLSLAGKVKKPPQISVLIIALMAAALIVFAVPDLVYAFHEGGDGYCEGCHVLHESPSGQIQGTGQTANTEPASVSLRGPDPSSVCLRCHAEEGKPYSVYSKDGSMYTPGGDFYWLRKSFVWNADFKSHRSAGDSHGHNVVAADYGLNPDATRSLAPGGVYPAAILGCISCHNPHGRTTDSAIEGSTTSESSSYGQISPSETSGNNYRLLGGVNYDGGNQPGGISFVYPAPIALASSNDWTENDSSHPEYGYGMSEWCGNCHPEIVDGGHTHPSGKSAKLSNSIIANYNSYVKTGDLTGTPAISYLSLVPFEVGIEDKSFLDPSGTSGPDISGNPNVMCLTCHRAHASAFQAIGRWDFQATLMADSHPQLGDGGVTGIDVLNSYYGRDIVVEFGKYQRQFCNKCHLQD